MTDTMKFDMDDVDGELMREIEAFLKVGGVGMDIDRQVVGGEVVSRKWRLAQADGPEWLRDIQRRNHEWREENVPSATRLSCAGHVVGEAAELQDHYVKAAEYEGREVDELEAKKEAGDVIVSLMSLLSMEGWDVVECIRLARQKNDDRDWDEHTGRADL